MNTFHRSQSNTCAMFQLLEPHPEWFWLELELWLDISNPRPSTLRCLHQCYLLHWIQQFFLPQGSHHLSLLSLCHHSLQQWSPCFLVISTLVQPLWLLQLTWSLLLLSYILHTPSLHPHTLLSWLYHSNSRSVWFICTEYLSWMNGSIDHFPYLLCQWTWMNRLSSPLHCSTHLILSDHSLVHNLAMCMISWCEWSTGCLQCQCSCWMHSWSQAYYCHCRITAVCLTCLRHHDERHSNLAPQSIQ